LNSQGIDIGPHGHPPGGGLRYAFDDEAAAFRPHANGQAQVAEVLIEMQAGLQLFPAGLWVGVEVAAEGDDAVGEIVNRRIEV
jgi:hypothetical protein